MAPGPLLKGRETRRPDRFSICRLVVLEQPVTHQKLDAALAYFDRRNHDHAFSAAFAQASGTDG